MENAREVVTSKQILAKTREIARQRGISVYSLVMSGHKLKTADTIMQECSGCQEENIEAVIKFLEEKSNKQYYFVKGHLYIELNKVK